MADDAAGDRAAEPVQRPVQRPVQQPEMASTSVPVALSTASVYPATCTTAFEIASRLGYDGVEVMVWTDPVSQDPSTWQRLSEHYGLPVLAVHAPTLLVTQRVWGKEPWPKLERACEAAAAVGAPTVVVHPPFRWQRDYAADFVAGVRELCERTGIVVAVENMYPWRARQREIVAYAPGWDPLDHDYRHVTYDLSHAAIAGADPVAQVARLGDRLAHLHLADGTGSAKDEHLIPGRGTQPCDQVLAHLGRTGWRGTVVAEVNTRKARDGAERDADLAQTLAYARRYLAAGRQVQDVT